MNNEVATEKIVTEVPESPKMPCPRCTEMVTLIFPHVEIINGETTSALIAAHKEVRCTKCGMKFRTHLVGTAGTKFQWFPIADTDTMLGEQSKEREPQIVITDKMPKGIKRTH